MKKRIYLKPSSGVTMIISCIIVLFSYLITVNYGAFLTDAVGRCALFSMPEGIDITIKDFRNRFFERIEMQQSDTEYFQREGSIIDFELKRQFRDLTVTPDDIKESEALLRDDFLKNYTQDGTVTEKTYIAYQATDSHENVHVRNVTVDADIDVEGILSNGCKLPVKDYTEPVVLIYHTHSTECYNPVDNSKFSTEYPERNEDIAVNVVRVGEEIAAVLRARGIGVIHDTTVYDTVYTGAYDKSRTAVTEVLSRYPSVVITLDVHRDAIHYDDTTRVKPVTEIDNIKAAQIMIISGAEGGNVESFPLWETNLSFALNLMQKVNTEYENLMKPVYFCNRRYNMDLTPYSLLVEVGTDMNTLSEAAYSGRLLGDVLAEFIKENVKTNE